MEGKVYPYRSILISEEFLFSNEGMIELFKIEYFATPK